MFEELSYVGYTALFCLPPLVLLWLRREFFEVLAPKIRPILASTLLLTLYGSIIWPVAIRHGAWAYRPDRITGVKLLDYVYLDDVVWWLLVSALFSSFVALSAHHERRGVDVVSREIRGLARSFLHAFRGLRVIPLERNSTVHIAAAVFVLLEGLLFRIGPLEWLFVILAVGLVLGFEILNSSLERLASLQARGEATSSGAGGAPQSRSARGGEARSPEIALIKDAAAAGVMISALAAAGIGAAIFLSRILDAVSAS